MWISRAVKEACSELVPKMVGEKKKLTVQVVEAQFSCREKGAEGNWTSQPKKEKPGSRVAVAVTVMGPDVVPTSTSPKSTDDGEKLIDIAWVTDVCWNERSTAARTVSPSRPASHVPNFAFKTATFRCRHQKLVLIEFLCQCFI